MSSKEKGVILDRDGTLISERGDYNYLPEHVELLPGVIENLWRLQSKGYLLFVATNQGGIAKGLYSHEHVKEVHDHLDAIFKKRGIEIADWHYSPDHDSLEDSHWRKPNPGMMEDIIRDYQLDPQLTWVVGDKDRDIQAGKKVGANTYLVRTNEGLGSFVAHVLQYHGIGPAKKEEQADNG